MESFPYTKMESHKKSWHPKSQPLYGSSELGERISEIATTINHYFIIAHPQLIQEPPIIFVIMNGAMMFASDLMKQLKFDFEYDALKFSSYEHNKKTSAIDHNIIYWNNKWHKRLKGRSVIILEDIVDTGDTMKVFLERVQLAEPLDCKIVSLFERKGQKQIQVDWKGFTLNTEEYIYGYGLDDNETKRHLHSIYTL